MRLRNYTIRKNACQTLFCIFERKTGCFPLFFACSVQMAHRRANLSEALARLHGKIAYPRQIRERQKPDKPALTGYRQTSDLLARHEPRRQIDVHILRHAHKPLCHHAPHAHTAGRSVRCHTPDNQIPVRHHAAQPPVPAAHWQRADVVLRQEPRRHGDSLLRRNGNDPAAHDLFDLHCSPLPDKNRLPRRCRDRRSFLLVWERGRQIIPVLSYL